MTESELLHVPILSRVCVFVAHWVCVRGFVIFSCQNCHSIYRVPENPESLTSRQLLALFWVSFPY